MPPPGPTLATDDELLAFVGDIVGEPLRHQFWFLTLDSVDRVFGVVIHMDLPPVIPTAAESAHFGGNLCDSIRLAGAASLVVVLERGGGRALTRHDRAWLGACVDASIDHKFRLRGPILVSDQGARWIGMEDL